MKTAIVFYKNPRKGKEKGVVSLSLSLSLSLSKQLNSLDIFLSLPLRNFSFACDFFEIGYFEFFSFKFT